MKKGQDLMDGVGSWGDSVLVVEKAPSSIVCTEETLEPVPYRYLRTPSMLLNPSPFLLLL